MSDKKKKVLKWVFIGIGLTVLTITAVLILFVYLFLFGGPKKVIKNVDRYDVIFDEPGVHSGYMAFPEHIDKDQVVSTEFYHSYQDTLFTPTIETYLQCIYTDEGYEKEIERLRNVKKQCKNEVKTLLSDDENLFQYPAFIAVLNAANTYEYALLTGENEITYVCTMYTLEKDVHFDQSYLPKDYMSDENRSFGSGYSIYYTKVTPDAIESDYTRNEKPDIFDAHQKGIGKDSFVCYTIYNESGEEVITGVSFFLFHDVNKEDTVTEFPVEDDMIYKGIDYNDERNGIIITYEKDGKLQTKEYVKP